MEAVTGSGKTFAYLLPLLELLKRNLGLDDDCSGNNLGEGSAQPVPSGSASGVQSLILLPTRELAIQVFAVLQSLLASAPGHVASSIVPQLLVGGGKTQFHTSATRKGLDREGEEESEDDGIGAVNTAATDYARFRRDNCNILIGTPGRMEELLSKKLVRTRCKTLELLVLDEADRLLDLGFFDALTTILEALPKQRRTALFSATMSDSMDRLVRLGLRNPVRVTVKVEMKQKIKGNGAGSESAVVPQDQNARMPATLENFFLVVPHSLKVAQLVRLLSHETKSTGARKLIVFFATCRQVEYFYKVLGSLKNLAKEGVRLYSLHGKQDPKRRSAVYRSFVDEVPLGQGSNHASSVLLCTDVASRGLDLPSVDLVVQFDPPVDPKVFQHRIGRTARAGRSGRAVCFLARGSEESYIDFLKLRGIVRSERYPYLSESAGQIEASSEAADSLQHDEAALRLTSTLRNMHLADLATHDLFVLAMVSYVRAYGKHEARFIFTLKDLVAEVRDLARSWGGVRLPRMSELKDAHKSHSAAAASKPPRTNASANDELGESNGTAVAGADEADGWLDGQLDVRTWGYKDPAKEASRLAKLEQKQQRNAVSGANEDGEDESTSTNATSNVAARKRMRTADEQASGAWSNQKRRKERKEERKEKKLRKKQAIKAKTTAEAQAAAKQTSAAGDGSGTDDESEDDWAAEEREFKRDQRARRRDAARKAGERGLRAPGDVPDDSDDGFASDAVEMAGNAASGSASRGDFFDDM